MERKINWTFLLLIVSFIGHSLSSVFFPFVHQDPEKAYTKSRSESVHRGVFLSYPSPKKINICVDLFSEDSHDKTVISDDLKNKGQPQHSLIVGRVSQFVQRYWLDDKVDDLFFKCSGKNLRPGHGVDFEYYVSSTFRHGFVYNGAFEYKSEGLTRIMLNGYIGMSPEYVSLEQTELEEQYIASRRIIRDLAKESPIYVKMIEKRDDLSVLSAWQKFLLCSSFISSPNLKSDPLTNTFSLNWVEYTKNMEKGIQRYEEKRLTFNDKNYEKEKLGADCLYCTPPAEAARDPRTVKRNLLLTRAYNDKHSLYVLLEENGVVRLKKYAKKVPILMNFQVPFTDDPDYIHRSELQ